MITAPVLVSRPDLASIRSCFPLLDREIKGHPLVYFDNAATSQKPQVVIDAIINYYSTFNANIHRGIHTLAEEATAAFEATRDLARQFIGAASREEVIFTRGTTEGINLVANAWGRQNLTAGDEVIISAMEHHSNIVPWQMICAEKNAVLKVIPVTGRGELDMEAFRSMITSKTKMVSVVHASNALGTINPVKEIIDAAHCAGALVFIDGAQSAVHLDINVVDLDCDFFAFSGHKLFGPTGVGILYGKKSILEAMPPFLGGGEMIREVTFEKTTYNDLPYKFEAGTPNIADVVAMKSAFEFVNEIGKETMREQENDLLQYATAGLRDIAGVRIIGEAKEKVSVLSFVVAGLHPQDIGTLLDNRGIAVRTGHHCAGPLMQCYGLPGTIRASFAVYNTREEVDRLLNALPRAIKMLS